MNRHDERMKLHDHLVATLRAACGTTGERDFEAECRAVLDAANLWAISHPPLTTVTAETVNKCDQMAAGHIDWVTKFPLYVSERVYGMEVPR